MGIFTACGRCLLIIFNIISVIACLVAIALGITTFTSISINTRVIWNEVSISGDTYLICGVLLIIVGGIIGFATIFGCLGAAKKHSTLLILYCTLLIIIIGLLVAVIVVSSVTRAQIMDPRLNSQLTAHVHSKYGGDIPAIRTSGPFTEFFQGNFSNALFAGNLFGNITRDFTTAFNDFQNYWKCCGVSNYTDYLNITQLNKNYTTKGLLPESCCTKVSGSTPQPDASCGPDAAAVNGSALQLNARGCFEPFVSIMEGQILFPVITASAVGLLMIVALILTGCLVCCMRKD